MTPKLKIFLLVLLALWSVPAFAQGAVFTYRGHLTAAGVAVNSPHDLEFRLFDSAEVGAGVQRGTTKSQAAVPVANGGFTVTLDFGAAVFDGSPRFLEIGVRPSGSAGSYTTLAPRQQVASIPYAIHSFTAGTAQTATTATTLANGAAVRSLNNLKDNITLAAGANVTITPSGNTLTIASSGGGGGGAGLWSLAGLDAYYTKGNVGIGTSALLPGVRLEVKGTTVLEPGGSGGGFISFATPNAETGMTINGNGNSRADLRFDGSTLKLLAGTGVGPPSPANGIAITTDGNVSIGTTAPLPSARLNVKGTTVLEPGGIGGGFISFATPNTETGMTINGNGNSRADLRFDGSTLKLLAGTGVGPPSAANGLAINTAGNVGIGTTAPIAKLHAEATLAGIAVYGNAPGTSGIGVYGHAPGAGGVGVYAKSADGPAVHADGNATQAQTNGGFVKAMLSVNRFGRIENCYNGVSGLSADGCGFQSTGGGGVYHITFPFPVSGRFVSVTAKYGRGSDAGDTTYNRGANYRFPSNSDRVIDVYTFGADEPNDSSSSDFMILVF